MEGTPSCSADGQSVICEGEAGEPVCEKAGNETDDDCDGEIDEEDNCCMGVLDNPDDYSDVELNACKETYITLTTFGRELKTADIAIADRETGLLTLNPDKLTSGYTGGLSVPVNGLTSHVAGDWGSIPETMRVAAIPTFDDDSIETCREYGYQRYYDLWAFSQAAQKSNSDAMSAVGLAFAERGVQVENARLSEANGWGNVGTQLLGGGLRSYTGHIFADDQPENLEVSTAGDYNTAFILDPLLLDTIKHFKNNTRATNTSGDYSIYLSFDDAHSSSRRLFVRRRRDYLSQLYQRSADGC